GSPQAQRAPLAGQHPQPHQVSLPGQLVRAFCLARLGVVHGLAGCALRYRGGERGQKLRASLLQVPASAGVVRVWSERGDLIGAPYAQWHRGEDLLELAVVGSGEQPEGAPFAWLERRTPQPEQVSGRRELVRAGGLTSADSAAADARALVRMARMNSSDVVIADIQMPPITLMTGRGQLTVTVAAVERHVTSIFDKLGLHQSPDQHRRGPGRPHL